MKWCELDARTKPSRNTLEAAFPGKGKELRNLIDGTVNPAEYDSVIRLCMRVYHHPTYSYMLMTAINEVLEGHGIEYLCPKDPDHPSYDYINSGDVYNATILLRNDGKLIVSSLGDIVDRHMDWYD